MIWAGEFPTVENFREWRLKLMKNAANASTYRDQCMKWLREVLELSMNIENFRDSGRHFSSIDDKLGVALTKIARGEAARKIHLYEEQAQ